VAGAEGAAAVAAARVRAQLHAAAADPDRDRRAGALVARERPAGRMDPVDQGAQLREVGP
jgi:hypothetical protein